MTTYASLLAQSSSTSGPFWYLTEELSVIAPHLLRTDTAPMLKLHAAGGESSSSQDPMVSLWMGSPGVVTQLHYDMPANLFVQLR